MAKRSLLTEEDRQLFREAVKGSEELQSDQIDPYHKKHRPYPRWQQQQNLPRLNDALSEPLATEGFLFFARPGLQHRLLHDLQRGRILIERDLDLHGLRVSDAREILTEFLVECRRHHLSCIRIIHGKGFNSEGGKAVIKHHLNNWLRQCEEVLAFCSATRRDGGSGAAYVLLKRRRKDHKGYR